MAAVEIAEEPAAAIPPMATIVDQRTGIVIYGITYPRDPCDLTRQEVREHLFLPEEAAVEVLDHRGEGGVTEVGISWPKDVDGKVVLDHIRRIIQERMIRVV
jgi:hypothetical protein